MIFDVEIWLWKSNFGFPITPILKIEKKKNLWVCWFLGKNLSNFVSFAWQLYNPYYIDFFTIAD